MDLSTLRLYRERLARCFTRAQGALGDVCDALLTDLSARSLIDLTQAACFRRRWPSVYAALADGQVERPALQRLFVESAPRPAAGQRLVLAIDASSIARPEARTAPDRTLVHVPNLPAGCAPVRPGWAFSTVVVVPAPVSSWTHILDNRRIASTETAVSIAAQQLRELLPLLPERPIGLLDGGYGTVSWVTATAQLPLDHLVRITRIRMLSRPAPPPTGKRGAPRKDGARFTCSDPTTHGEPDAHWSGTDAQGKQITVSCWGGFHLKECREITLTVVRIVRAGAEGTKSDPGRRGSGGWGVPPFLLWRRWGGCTRCASAWNTAIASTNKTCCGPLRTSALPTRCNAGPMWWRRCIIRSAWPAPSSQPSGSPGRRRPARSPPARCAAAWGRLLPRLVPWHPRPDPAVKRPDAPPARLSSTRPGVP